MKLTKNLSVTLKLFTPHFFKNVEKSPIVYAANNNAWATFNICQHYVTGILVKKKKTENCFLYTGIHCSVF